MGLGSSVDTQAGKAGGQRCQGLPYDTRNLGELRGHPSF